MPMLAAMNLKPGMVLATDVLIQDNKVLIPKGVKLTDYHIKRINDFAIDIVIIEEQYQTQFDVNQSVAETTKLLAHQFATNLLRPTSKNPFTKKILTKIEIAMDELLNERIILDKLLDVRTLIDHTYRHSVRTTVLSLAVGVNLDMNAEKLKVLGTAALLHDIGKRMIPPEILLKDEKLTPEEQAVIRRHPQESYNILKTIRGIHPDVAPIVLQHHERYDGSGYPHGTKNSSMSLAGKILAVADVFEAITGDRAHRKRFSPADAVEYLLGSGDYLFDSQIVKAFVEHLATYRLGSMVRLSTGELAMVTDIARQISTRPLVMCLYDPDGRRYSTPRELDLSRPDQATIQIEQVLD